jgi:cobyrinic acid a,c-diamide synthase
MAANLSRIQPCALREGICRKRPTVYAECGGLMYLCRTLEKADGHLSMVGLLPSKTLMHHRIQSLSYTEVLLKEDSLWGRRVAWPEAMNSTIHRFCQACRLGGWCSTTAQKTPSRRSRRRGFQKNQVLASYVHLHLQADGTVRTFY